MIIGFDAKRAYQNFTGLGNYSRDLIENLVEIYPENEYRLFAPKEYDNPRLNFLSNNKNISSIFPESPINKTFKGYGDLLILKNQLLKVKLIYIMD